MTIEISFLGAAREVGRSCILVKTKGYSCLLDCGVKFENRKVVGPLLEKKQIQELDEVIISHAHLDHSGYAPALYAQGYKGKIICTKPTRDLMQLLLSDALHIQKDYSPYNQKNLDEMMKNTEIVEYKAKSKSKKAEFQDAGHILGSAITTLDVDNHKIIYTGDINLRASKLLDGADVKNLEGDTLIIESTYGCPDDIHPASKTTIATFIEHIRKTLNNGGKVIIPTFAIGRGQEILNILENHMRSGVLPKCPIYLDGMVKTATRIYRHNAIYLSDEIKKRILTSDDDPFKSPFYHIPTSKTKKDVLDTEKCIIVTTSGMLVGGPVVTYLQHLGSNKHNKMILVGFQAQGTPGRELLEGAKELKLDGQIVEINLQIEQAPFSAHSDNRELVQIAKSIKGLQRIFIVHGDPTKQDAFIKTLQKAFKKEKTKIHAPQLGETIKI